MRNLLAVVLLAALARAQQPELAVAELFTDHMVLQRDQPITLFGRGAPGAAIRVRFVGHERTGKVGETGTWIVGLPQLPHDGKSHELVVTDDRGGRVVLRDVLLGDVWITAGQSNMSRGANGEQMKTANHPKIRFFNSCGVTPRERRLDWATGWTVCTPESIKTAGDRWVHKKTKKQTVRSFAEVGYVFGRTVHAATGIPIGLIQASAGGSKATDWIPVPGIETRFPYGQPVEKTKHTPGLLYHIRVRRLTLLNIKGVVWYQGEDDGRNLKYAADLTRLITTWRKLFRNESMPFYMAQIGATSYASGMLAVYEAQQDVMRTVPHTGIGFSNDIYARHVETISARLPTLQNAGARKRTAKHLEGLRKRLFRTDKDTGWPLHGMSNPHPQNKELIGVRLGRIALKHDYGKYDGEVFGPMLDKVEVQGDKVRVRFRHVGTGLRAIDDAPLTWFELSDGTRKKGGRSPYRYVKAVATITGKDTVEVRADGMMAPKYVRFGWHMYARNNLANSDGIPAFPFRTDDHRDPRQR